MQLDTDSFKEQKTLPYHEAEVTVVHFAVLFV